jgi:hypothetical protein
LRERPKRQIATANQTTNHWTAILLPLITLLALALRLYRLGAQSLWYDLLPIALQNARAYQETDEFKDR